MATAACALVACTPEDPEVLFSGRTMGTTYHIKLVPGEKPIAAQVLQQQVDDALKAVNQSMSTYIDDSELSLLNRAPVDTWIKISQPLLDVLLVSREVSELSGGAFDITAGPLVNLWGFGPEDTEDKVPDEQTIRRTMERVGYHNLQIDVQQRRVRKLKDVYLDLSAVAKGYGTDVLAELFLQQDLNNFMIEIGGELRVSGVNGEGKPWRIGVEKPGLMHEGAVQALDISNVGIATSGDYRNYFEVNGERYSHTIDPSTGRPITHSLASVTVIANTGAKADALATALNVLGPEKGFELASRLHLPVYFLVREGDRFTVRHTPEFKQYMVEL